MGTDRCSAVEFRKGIINGMGGNNQRGEQAPAQLLKLVVRFLETEDFMPPTDISKPGNW